VKRARTPGLKPKNLWGGLRGPFDELRARSEGPLFRGDRRQFLRGMTGLVAAALTPAALWAADPPRPSFRLTDVTNAAGLHFKHYSGAFGGKFLPETLGSGCAFLDYDADGWQIFSSSTYRLAGHGTARPTLQLYRNNRNGTFTDVTTRPGSTFPICTVWEVAVGDYNNERLPRHLVTCVGQNRLFAIPQGHVSWM